jgi:SAM-dependent methyltransferase
MVAANEQKVRTALHLDVSDLRNFYYRSTLGRAAQKVVRDELVRLWPSTKGQTVAGYGFAVPLLRPFLAESRRVIGLMPGPQGVMAWPPGAANVSVLCDETLWPLETGHVDRLVLMHGLETSDTPAAVMDEAFRVLGPGGRAVFIVPNRAGLWSRSDNTPFGYGRPYSLHQLENQLDLHDFVIERSCAALYQAPSHKRFWRKTAGLLERAGHRLPFFAPGGVLVIEASKKGNTPVRPGLGETVTRPLKAFGGMGAPVPEPTSRMRE